MINITANSPAGYEFLKEFRRIEREQEQNEKLWIEKLRSLGVKLAHPDDGWVNREQNNVYPVYPQFDDKPQVGDLIALGWPGKCRIVKVTKIETPKYIGNSKYYFFEPTDL